MRLFVRDKESAPVAPKGTSLLRFWLIGWGLIAVFFLASTLILYWHLDDESEQQVRDQARSTAESFGFHLQGELEQLRNLLQTTAKDPQLAALLQRGETKAIQAKEASLEQVFPPGSRIRLLPRGHNEPDTTRMPHLGWASLDLLRTAETTPGMPPVEVHQLNTPQVHIALAVRLGQADPPEGLLHLAIPLSWLNSLMTKYQQTSAILALRQIVKTNANPAFARNRPQEPPTTLPGVVPLPDSIWELAYWPLPRGTGLRLGVFLLWTLLFIALSALVMVRLGRRQIESLSADLTTLDEVLAPAFQQRKVPLPSLRLREISAWVARLGSARPEAEASTQIETAALQLQVPSALGEPVAQPPPASAQATQVTTLSWIPPEIFRAYDIRGLVGETLTPEMMYDIGLALGSEAAARGRQSLLLARDGRDSSPELAEALGRGLMASGRNLIDLGLVPTPLLYFATHFLGTDSGAMITGSHNPPRYNGVKMVLAGETLGGEGIQALRNRLASGSLTRGDGSLQHQDLIPDYTTRIADDIHMARPLTVVVDSGNGVAGVVAPALFRELGCEVIELYSEVDGQFPNHHPDPNEPDNLQALIAEVLAQGADLGLAFDGDGDRLGVVDAKGKIIWPDRLLMYFAADVLTRHPGTDVVFDVKCSQHLGRYIRLHGGRPVMGKTGHSFLKAKVKESGALVGGEFSGHIVFAERWFGFDDALYAAARLLELLSMDDRPTQEVFAELPEGVATPELKLTLAEGEAATIMEELATRGRFPNGQKNSIDGLRIEFPQGWGLVRPSNTTPALIFRFEANHADELEQIQDIFRQALYNLRPHLHLPF